MAQSSPERHDELRDGIIVWDHEGVVVVWPDRHHSRFSWESLRAFCQCEECKQQDWQRVAAKNEESAPRQVSPAVKSRKTIYQRTSSMRRRGFAR